MAELNSTATHSRKPGVRRAGRSAIVPGNKNGPMSLLRLLLAFGRRTGGSPRLSTRVDLTPMVDLGFLLITFFMVSTSWSKPKASTLFMPAKGAPMNIGQGAALTVIPLRDNKIFYYHGDLDQSMKEGTYGITGYGRRHGIRDIILEKQLAMDRSYKGGRKEMMLLIKPSPESSYQNTVSLLDEVLINDVKHYALMDIAREEQDVLKAWAAGTR